MIVRPLQASLGLLCGAMLALLGCQRQELRPAPKESKPDPAAVAKPVPADEGYRPWAQDREAWTVHTDGKSRLDLGVGTAPAGEALVLNYQLDGSFGFIEIWRPITEIPDPRPFTFLIQADSSANLELKFEDSDGSIFGQKIKLEGQYPDWTPVTLYWNNFEYWWAGRDDQFGAPARFYFAVSGTGQGTVRLARIGPGPAGLTASFPPAGPRLDPDRNLEGIGFRQRRAEALIPEDPLVLEWLKQLQDTGSQQKLLLPNMIGEPTFQTFNNSLVVMAYVLKGERERAERILDFFARATDHNNDMLKKQNFFYRGEARGFYQDTVFQPEHSIGMYVDSNNSDRWMGDMVWLLYAYLHYQQEYHSHRYEEIISLVENLLLSYYKDAEHGSGGYIQHGWRAGDDHLHEPAGHPEGNIDCYALFKLRGRTKYANKIRAWLDPQLKGNSLPLDLYTWRVLAYGRESVHLLDIPEFDFRYRKILKVDGKEVTGLYHAANPDVNNIWLDGVGHIACAYLNYGDPQRGYFYANQLDALKTHEEIGGVRVHGLPYTVNQQGGYEWVDPRRGFVSVAAWYILAKNGFNPMTLTRGRVGSSLPSDGRTTAH